MLSTAASPAPATEFQPHPVASPLTEQDFGSQIRCPLFVAGYVRLYESLKDDGIAAELCFIINPGDPMGALPASLT